MSIAVEKALDGLAVFWGAPTYDQVRICWGESKHAALGAATFNQQRMTADFPGGGKIIYRSLDNPDNARGHTSDLAIIDEAAMAKEAAWYEVIRPMLIDTGGGAWFLFTPTGRNWVWREHRAALDRDDSMAWEIPTLGFEIVDGQLIRKPHPLENPNIPWAEIQQIYADTPERIFRQELGAEFIEGAGIVFRNIQACINAPESTPEEHEGHYIVAGVDWGKHNDFTCASVGCATCKQELALDRFNQIDYVFQRARLAALMERWDVGYILAESNAMGEPIIEQLQYDGLPVEGFQTTASSKPPLIENLALTLERTEWQFLSIPVATAELEAYERKVSVTTGRSQYGAPEGLHDDTVIARALMRRAAGDGGPAIIEIG